MQQPMLNLINGTSGLISQVFEAQPDQQGTRNVIALHACFAALAGLDPRQLLELAVILLNLPAQRTRLLCTLRRVLSQIVSDDPVRAVWVRAVWVRALWVRALWVRAVWGHHNPKEFHLLVAGLSPGKPLILISWPCCNSASLHLKLSTRW